VYLAVQKHGVGNWAAVVSDGGLPVRRTNVQVKDKWRTMQNQGRLTELRAKFGHIRRRHTSPTHLTADDDDDDDDA